MTKARTKPESPTQEKPRSGLDAFIHHQGKALEETGKAFASLLPKDFRTHAGNAVEECMASFEALADGVIDTVECGLDKLRTKPKEDDDTAKVKVEVE
jgi:cytochrome c556